MGARVGEHGVQRERVPVHVVEQGDHPGVYSIGAVSGGLEEVAPAGWDTALRAAGLADAYYARGYVAASARSPAASPCCCGSPRTAAPCSSPDRPWRPRRRRHPLRLRRAGRRRLRAAARGVHGGLRGLVRRPRGGVELRRLPPAARQRGVAGRGWLAPDRAGRHGRVAAGRRPGRGHAPASPAAVPARARRWAGGSRRAAAGRPDGVRRALRGDDAARRRGALLPVRRRLLGRAAHGRPARPRRRARRTASWPRACSGWAIRPGCTTTSAARRTRAGAPGRASSRCTGSPRWGQEHGYELLHLGGGVGGRADSLLEYKLRFAPDGLAGAAIGKAVHDEPVYLERAGAGAVDWDGFFPAYRAPR